MLKSIFKENYLIWKASTGHELNCQLWKKSNQTFIASPLGIPLLASQDSGRIFVSLNPWKSASLFTADQKTSVDPILTTFLIYQPHQITFYLQ